MSEQNSGAAPIDSTPPAEAYKDRLLGLMIFGCLTIGMGCLCGLFVPLMLFGQMMSAKTTGEPANFATILPATFIYGILAVALIWLGIGSMMARRWARALLLIFSWSWLVMGVLTLGFMGFLMPKIFANLPNTGGTAGQPQLPPGALTVMMAVMFLAWGVIFIILPAVWTFFYGSRHVKATCEARDQVPRWTDACPLPVLGVSTWLWFSAASLLLMAIGCNGVMPFFGMFLSGWPGTMFCLGMAAIWGLAAWWLYRLDRRGWWLIVIALCAFVVSGALTYARHDILEMYRLMGIPEGQLKDMQKTGMLTGNLMGWMMLIWLAPLRGYLLYIKKFLRR